MVIPSVVFATMVRKDVTIDMMVKDAGYAFCGKVVDIAPDKDSKFTALNPTKYTFELTDIIFMNEGTYKVGDRLSFTHAGVIKGMRYVMGESYCGMFYALSKIGFTSPVNQSAYKVDKRSDGTRRLKLNTDRETIFRDVVKRNPGLSKSLNSREKNELTRKSREMDVEDFISIIRKIREDSTRNSN